MGASININVIKFDVWILFFNQYHVLYDECDINCLHCTFNETNNVIK